MSRFLISDPFRPDNEQHNVVDSWDDVCDELSLLDDETEQPEFGEPIQVMDGNSLVTITRLE